MDHSGRQKTSSALRAFYLPYFVFSHPPLDYCYKFGSLVVAGGLVIRVARLKPRFGLLGIAVILQRRETVLSSAVDT